MTPMVQSRAYAMLDKGVFVSSTIHLAATFKMNILAQNFYIATLYITLYIDGES